MQLELIEQIPPEQKIGFITLDGADTVAGAASRQIRTEPDYSARASCAGL